MGILNFVQKKYKEAKTITFITLIFENIGGIICILALIALLLGIYFKFFDYMHVMGLFSFYNIDYSLYSSDDGYLFSIIKGIMFFFFMIINFLILYKLLYARKVISNSLICVLFFATLYINNLFISLLYGINGFVGCSVFSLIFILLEMLVIKIFTDKKSKLYKLFEKISLVVKVVIFGFVFVLLSFMVAFLSGFCHFGEVLTIDNKSVILYKTSDYYITSPCDVVDRNVYVYSSYQAKVLSDNICVTKEKYNRIIVKSSLDSRL